MECYSAVFVDDDYFYLNLKTKRQGELDQFNPNNRLKVSYQTLIFSVSRYGYYDIYFEIIIANQDIKMTITVFI